MLAGSNVSLQTLHDAGVTLRRTGTGLVPDFMFAGLSDGGREVLAEIKTLGWTLAHFPEAATRLQQPGGPPLARGVERRATQSPPQYRCH